MTASALEAASAAAPPAATRPFSAFEWMVAFRYLRARRAHGSVSVIAGFSFAGIVLGVMALIVVMSVMNGFHHDLMEKMIGLNGHVFLQGVEKPLTDYDAVTERVSKVPGVALALPLVEGQAFATSPFNSGPALVRGVREADLKRLPGIEGHITQGTLDGFDSGPGVAIGARLAEHLSLRVGDKITLIAPRGAETPFGVTPRVKSYVVAAIFQIGMATFDNTFVFMPLSEAQAYFNLDGQANVIEVYVDDPERMDAMRERIAAAEQRPMIDTDWRQLNKSFFDVLTVEANVMFAILTLIVLVAALNIISGLIMLVQDKARAIAVLRTMGATRGAIMRIFLIIGATIGFVGTACGLALGLIVAENVEPIRKGLSWLTGRNLFPAEFYYLSQLPSRVEARDVIAVAALALILSLLATIYPSWRAARLDPVEALRYE
ncbi:MAG: lipoprotein-releasing ABC transporter permease subunit [Roseiarcus sp.]|jgi:lipoprotein-releasing system permease protein|uniref:lipoprotein-releasing ABC transporter permease subunit n=1 Tax=Roseiarcus sp. TaxID=1969460 RepID=UPI003C201F01